MYDVKRQTRGLGVNVNKVTSCRFGFARWPKYWAREMLFGSELPSDIAQACTLDIKESIHRGASVYLKVRYQSVWFHALIAKAQATEPKCLLLAKVQIPRIDLEYSGLIVVSLIEFLDQLRIILICQLVILKKMSSYYEFKNDV